MNADEVRRSWAERSAEYSPGYYAYYGPNEASAEIRRTLDRHVDRTVPVLELGCSAGRHLKHLHDHGYERLHGLDINGAAFDVMAAEYPALADAGTFYDDAIEDAVPRMDDGQFGAVFSVQALQHVHADAEWVFGELARITDDVLVTVECEESAANGEGPEIETVGDTRDGEPGDGTRREENADGDGPTVTYRNGDFPLYYRPWERIFTGLGLVQVEARSVGGDTLRAFRRA